ncbi:hypothetical protein OHA21_23815 [Actinoplanes sp. NBC_00393]|uniref:hypothetical protein n=1 Tax=Actinoplanes sp. NBC_00393 TaxID=2975953 RepID=UPI002E1BEE39
MNAGKPPKIVATTAAVIATAAVVLLFGGFAVWFNGWSPAAPGMLSGGDAEAADREPGAGTLPARLGAPGVWTADGEQHPIGAASVLYSSNTWYFDGSDWYLGLVGKKSDTYRVLDLMGAAGMSSVLAPAGDRLAVPDGIVDLAGGRLSEYPAQLRELVVDPQAWSPDGTMLAVLTSTEQENELRLLEVATGKIRDIAPLSFLGALHGWTVAFSPDGGRLAYQVEDRIRVVPLNGGNPQDYEIPPGARLAGKGAWQPDGKGLLVVAGAECDCGDYPMRWTVTTVPIGAAAAPPAWTVDGAYALRVLGWSAGRPVAAEYTAVDGTPPATFADEASRFGLTSQDHIQSVRLVELGTGRVLLESDSGAESIDVADAVLAGGATRPGDPMLVDADFLLLAPIVLLGASIATLVTLSVWRRATGG